MCSRIYITDNVNFVVTKFQVSTIIDIKANYQNKFFGSCVAIHSHMTTKVGVAIKFHMVLPRLKF